MSIQLFDFGAASRSLHDFCIDSSHGPIYLCHLGELGHGLDSFWQLRPLALFAKAIQVLARGADGTGDQVVKLSEAA